MSTRIVLVPGTLALLPEHDSLVDPVPELRAACLAAVAWLGAPDEVLADDQGRRVADALLAAAGVTERAPGVERAVLVVGNGSATRSEKAPGHLDDRALAFDVALGAALRRGDLSGLDLSLADELWARLGGIPALVGLLEPGAEASVDHDAAPYGVQWWVMRWTCGS
ncbi:hypothetical protein GHK92_19830 [Nocardioides sp. dk4132]|uniref:hypothetical protein n=1 Tax=unclassified Nocardioides TaxID=2615069 RepID=UPI001295B9D0|nr:MULTISPECIES: hypothetical protein [unclassified Nocardioides]MQW78122.1 hypothetical protein [Nocardioides sp. dk4132]QGA09056.1 hypothetical protein GFH29_17875 [Nocardioides sp. dk884]